MVGREPGDTAGPRDVSAILCGLSWSRRLLLNVAYLVAAVLALPWVAWRRLSGRRPVAAPWTRFTGAIAAPPPAAGRPRLWLHGVSVGEVQLLAVLAAELRAQAEAAGTPVDCVISSSTTTGLEVAASRFGADRAFPCPLDLTWAVDRVLDRVAPDLIVLGELELWPNMLARAARRGIPVVVANARMSERSAAGYGRIRPLARRMLGRVGLVLARSQADADRFAALGADAVVVSVQDFTGPLTISTGELEANAGANALASASSIFVAGGATLADGGNGLTIVDGQTLAGNGTVNGDVLFDPGSILSPGGSVGTLTLGNATWSGSGSYVFDITNATLDSVTGAGLGGGWDLLDVNTLTINATTTNPYIIQLRSLTNGGDNTPGAMSGGNWDQDSDYQWLFVQATSEIASFAQGTFVFNTTGFVSGTNGDFYVYRGDDPNVIGGSSDQLYIVYAAVPEPGTLALAGVGLAVAGWAARRRRSPRRR